MTIFVIGSLIYLIIAFGCIFYCVYDGSLMGVDEAIACLLWIIAVPYTIVKELSIKYDRKKKEKKYLTKQKECDKI